MTTLLKMENLIFQNIKALIYKTDRLSFSVQELLNIATVPANSDKSNII